MRGFSLPFGTFFGAKLRLHVLLPVYIALAAWLNVLPYHLMLFALVLGHELCHAAAARLLGVEVLEIELAPFGGVARLAPEMELRPASEIVIALSGPAFNVLLVLLSAFAERFWPPDARVLSPFIEANLLLACFNLLPALPLDGGRVLRAAIALPLGLTRATKIAALSGVIVGGLLLAAGIWGAANGAVNATYLLCGVMLLLMAAREGRSAETLYLRDITARERALRREGALPVRWIAAAPETTVRAVARRMRPGSYHKIVLIGEGLRERCTLTETELTRAMLGGQSETPLGEIRFRHDAGLSEYVNTR